MEAVRKKAKVFLVIAIAMMLVSGIVVSLVQTSFGHVTVKHVYWEADNGIGISGNLYIPDTATADNPAPAVVTSHGYLNNKEMQDINGVELSRRGYVVLAIDQPGSGESDTADWQKQNGTGMNFVGVYQGVLSLSRMPFVDDSRIGVTGHSMGGMSSNFAVLQDSQSEKPLISAVLLNCIDAMYTDSPNIIGGIAASDADGNYVNLYGNRSVGIIASQYDEFFHKRTDANGVHHDAPDYMDPDNMDPQSFLNFGEDPTGKDYREAGTYYYKDVDGKECFRVIYNPAQIHPWSHFSARSATATIDFFDTAFGSPTPIASSNQIWQVKEAFNFVGMLGFVMFVISFTTTMLFTSTFSELRAGEVVQAMTADKKGIAWFAGATAVSTVISILTFNPVVNFGKSLPIAQQVMMMGIGLWACLCGLVTIATLYLSYRFYGKSAGIDLADRGVKISGRKLGKTVVLAILVCAVSYLCVFLDDYFFVADFRIWNVGFKIVDSEILGLSLFPHGVLFLVFYIAMSIANNSFNFTTMGGKKSWQNNLLLIICNLLPMIIMLVFQYGTYVATGHEPIQGDAMNVAQLFAFLLIVTGACVIDRVLYRVSKNPYLAGIITGILVSIVSCANTTTGLIMLS
ncbi:hypothetical protein AUL39_07435 [Tractidigestivibacter scatoligenes]|uniref:PET hydrolase/cutinase-like domain-containing protein n=1 Tax=Tractidigestivibacter scatoligenes TaxID=1299998 RepID=A0A124EGN6_TRASO|nr:alpha/beta hydrolase [Tractidigestivibacter scatoligenes]KUH58044.1 hypothetical protein AUL39_07435 [Tractidigestivibacter scatoligenes]